MDLTKQVVDAIENFKPTPEQRRVIESYQPPAYLFTDLEPDEIGHLSVLEAAADDAKKPSVYCVKDKKKVTPTDAGKCPDCGMDLSKAMSAAKKVQEAVVTALGASTS